MTAWVPRANIAGPPNTLTIGSVATLPDAASAYVNITGTSPHQVLHFGIPEGEEGPPNILTVGVVTTVPPDQPATVTITGTSPAQVINFGLPQGVPGPGAAGVNLGSGTPVFAGADAGTGIMEFWQIRGANQTSVTLDATGIKISSLVNWSNLPGIPSTFPPTLPITQSDVTGLVAGQAAQDTAINTKVARSGDTMSGSLTITGGAINADTGKIGTGADASALGASTLLQVNSNTYANFAVRNSGSDVEAQFGAHAVGVLLGAFTAHDVFIRTNNTNRITITALGDVLLAASPATADNDTSVATTAFVQANMALKANATHTHAQADITNLVSDLALKAPLASPALTGTPTAPTAATATSNTQIATTAFCKAAISAAGATATVSATAPGSPAVGSIWWNTTRKELTIWDGFGWEVVLGVWG